MERTHWQDWVVALIGLGLIAAPFVVDFALAEGARTGWITVSFVVSGLVIGGMAALAMVADQAWEEAGVGLAGAWLIVSPWALGFSSSTMPTGIALVGGIFAVALAIWLFGAGAERRHV